MEELLQHFESALQDMQQDPSLDAETCDLLRQQFVQTLGDLNSIEGTAAEIPGHAMWIDALQALQAGGDISESEANDVIRQVNHALQPLQRRESQIAIEFSRRLQSEGEGKALAWFHEEQQRAKDAEAAEVAVKPALGETSSPLRNEVVNSRSHRLRGPPR